MMFNLSINEGEGSSPQKTGLKFKLKENFSVFQKSSPHPSLSSLDTCSHQGFNDCLLLFKLSCIPKKVWVSSAGKPVFVDSNNNHEKRK
jgi:hypothetical protein